MKRQTVKEKARAYRLQRSRERRRLKRQAVRSHLRRYGRDRAGERRKSRVVTVRCPKRLTLRSDEAGYRAATLDFFSRLISTPNPDAGVRMMVDMRRCETIDIAAGVWLIATLEIASMRYPNFINGMNPENQEASAILDALRFHQTLKFQVSPEVEEGHALMRRTLEIETRSGGLNDSTGERMPAAGAAISEILPGALGDEEATSKLRDQIHRAMNEALLNVLQHAYFSENQNATQSEILETEHRWWATGLVHKEKMTLDLLVVDRGVGIPRTLRPKVREYAESVLSFTKLTHGDRIRAAMEYGRSSVSQGANRGKGMPQMLNLLERFPNSMLLVESLRGIYVARYDGSRLEQSHFDNDNALPGTLVWWHLDFGSGQDDRTDSSGTAVEGH